MIVKSADDPSQQQLSKEEKHITNYIYRRITTMEELNKDYSNRCCNDDNNDDDDDDDGDKNQSILQLLSIPTSLYDDDDDNHQNNINTNVEEDDENNIWSNAFRNKVNIMLSRTSHSSTSTSTDECIILDIETRKKHKQFLSRQERRAFNDIKRQQELKEAEEELARRAAKRQMTTNQELWNAITMLPSPLYALYFCFGGLWLNKVDIHNALVSMESNEDWKSTFDYSSSCLQSSILPNLHAIPPYTVIAGALALLLHSPVSIYYHILCAYKLPPGPKRMDHWARRLDQAMIHMMSFMLAYCTSANFDYFLITIAFNIDCMYRLFQKGMKPKATFYRMVFGFLLPALPFIIRREVIKTLWLMIIYGVSGWLFSTYPFGGWSHGAFHLVVFLSNPILIPASLNLDVGVVKDAIDTAAKCAAIALVSD